MNPIIISVGVKLLQGALSYAGGQLLARALGGPKLEDVRTWLRDAVSQLESFITAALDQQIIEKMSADLEGIVENLHEYAALSPQDRLGSRTLVDEADIHTASLIPLTLAYEQALFIAFAAMAYRFFALTSLYDLDEDKGHILSGKDMVDHFLEKTVSTYNTILARLAVKNRIRINCGYEPPGPPEDPANAGDFPGPAGYYWCEVTLDGKVKNSFQDWTDAAHARREAESYAATISQPVIQVFENFQATGTESLRTTVACYDAMCQKVGGHYTASIPIP